MTSDSNISKAGYRTNGMKNSFSAVMQGNHSMSCPGCNSGQILFNVYELLSGTSFSCTHCDVAISLTDAASKTVLQDTMDSMVKTIKETTA